MGQHASPISHTPLALTQIPELPSLAHSHLLLFAMLFEFMVAVPEIIPVAVQSLASVRQLLCSRATPRLE